MLKRVDHCKGHSGSTRNLIYICNLQDPDDGDEYRDNLVFRVFYLYLRIIVVRDIYTELRRKKGKENLQGSYNIAR